MYNNCAICLEMNTNQFDCLENCSHSICLNCKMTYTETAHSSNITVECKICKTVSQHIIDKNEKIAKYSVMSLGEFKIINEYTNYQQNNTIILEDSFNDFSFLKSNNVKDNKDNDEDNLKENQIFICDTHNKNLDAFCRTDYCLVCINCIVDGIHTSHDLVSVEKGYNEFKEILESSFVKFSQKEEELNSFKSQMLDEKSKLSTFLNQKEAHINDIFQKFRKVIDQHENEILDKIRKDYLHEVHKLNILESGINNQLYIISMLNKNRKLLIETKSQLSLLSDMNDIIKKIELANSCPPAIKPICDKSYSDHDNNTILSDLITTLKEIGNEDFLFKHSKKQVKGSIHNNTLKRLTDTKIDCN